MNNNTVTVRLVPQCECGYLFHQIELLYLGEPKMPQFSPDQCPSCRKHISCIEAPTASPFRGLTAIQGKNEYDVGSDVLFINSEKKGGDSY